VRDPGRSCRGRRRCPAAAAGGSGCPWPGGSFSP